MPNSTRKPRKRSQKQEREARLSLAFYFALVLLAGQFLARVIPPVLGKEGVPFDWLLLSGTFAIVLGTLFGPSFVIEFFKAVRGSNDDRSGEDDA